ncbi:MAG: hypothetical protein WA990_06610 [Rubrobacteraceae bacterium]
MDRASEKQNVTLSLPRETVREAKIMAAQRDTSISAMMVEMIAKLVEEERGYQVARERSLGRLREGYDLGSGGRASTSRDDLHER